jgi:hypothetical protein
MSDWSEEAGSTGTLIRIFFCAKGKGKCIPAMKEILL